jgi:zinc protease
VYVIPGGKPQGSLESYSEVRSITGKAVTRSDRLHDFNNISRYPTPVGWKHPLSFERKPYKIEYPPAESMDIGGAKVFFLPDHELPLVDLTLMVKAGAVDVDESKTGLAAVLTESIIRGGTEVRSPAELAQILDQDAVELRVAVSDEETVIQLSVLKDDWQSGLDILQEVLTRPGFDPNVLEIVKTRQLTELKRQGGDAQTVAGRERDIWLFKGHPYGRDPLAGLTTIPAVRGEDLKQFLRDYVVPSNLVAAVAGDIDQKELRSGLRQFFEALPKNQAPQRNLADPPQTPPVLALIHKPGQVQSQIVMSLPSVKRTHPDYWKLNLLMSIFGGNDSLLYTRLRDDLGLVYSAGFYGTYKWQAGILTGYIGCKGDKTAAAIAQTIEIMDSLHQDVPEKELEQKRLDALNSFVFNVDTPADLVNVYGRYYMRKEPLDTLARIQEAFFNVSRDDLLRLARQYLDSSKIQIFVVGDKLTKVSNGRGDEMTLEATLVELAESLGLPYREIQLR